MHTYYDMLNMRYGFPFMPYNHTVTVVRLGGSSLPVLGVWNGLSICGKWMEVAYMKVINR